MSVSIIDDELLENDEMFSLNLRSQSPDIVGVTTGRGQQNVTIIDNERTCIVVSVFCSIIHVYTHQEFCGLIFHGKVHS